MNEVIGKGIKFPIEIDQFGAVKTESGKNLIIQSIKRLLETPIGSQYFNRNFGSGLETLVFEQNNEVLFSLLDFMIQEAISNFEARVDLLSLNFRIEPKKPHIVFITITIRIKSNNEEESFVFPFFRELEN